ncbi:BRCA1-A complex subunit RAP80 [Danio aesculapii]|uniref:BRCA1-A complex subunit RAP80 n=1 Tax=Danio aesculapii TaxID=1142201 RepID=UPI0024BF821E|nr:BRCA1-A complex subunit RAP80 [Danio aesculapii]
MPRRKRTGDEGGRRAKVSRVELNEEPLVISDSDHEEEECTNNCSSRSARWKRRENKSHLRDMTEEEMLALAMRLSAQEANSAAQREELEDSDIQKAIAESLNESVVKPSDSLENEAGSSSDQPLENEAETSTNLRRKLCYPSQDQTHNEIERETSPLPEMPDLSQTTSSNISSMSPAHISRPPADTQDKQTAISDTPEFEIFKSLSESQLSPVLTRQSSSNRRPVVCVEKLSQELISVSADSVNVHTQNSIVTPSRANGSQFPEQVDSPLPKCPVFTQNDLRRGINLVEGKADDKSFNGKEDETQIPDEDTHLPTESSQGLSTESDTCLSPSRKSQLSSPKCVPKMKEDATLTGRTLDQKPVEDQTTLREKESVTESALKTQSWEGFTSHMVLLLPDDDEDDGSEEILSPSPVLHKEMIIRPLNIEISPTQSHVSSSTNNPSTQDTEVSRSVLEQDSRASRGAEFKPSYCKASHSSEENGERTVAYYWGVPFCPMGQNPEEYTRVIMCQMEVYEKSLKEAQRELLRKADWGKPVCPESPERSFGARRWKRHRATRLSEEEEENEVEAEKENNTIVEEEEKEEARDKSAVGTLNNADGGQSETYVVLSSPETKDEQVDKTPFFSQEEPETRAADKHIRNSALWDTSDETGSQYPAEQHVDETPNLEACEEDPTVCPETQMSESSTPELMMTSPAQAQSRADSEVMEVEDGGDAPAADEEMMMMMEQDADPAEPAAPLSEQMECPMCSKLFPISSIEMHAAYCDGEADQQDQQSQVVRRTRNRRQLMEDTHQSEKSAQIEKCSMCQGLFPLKEYIQHVPLCLERGSRANQENGLLSALERTEQRSTVSASDEPGPSDVSTKSNCNSADIVVMWTSESVSEAMVSSPSSTFTPPSEKTQCLTDSARNSLRLSRKRKYKK